MAHQARSLATASVAEEERAENDVELLDPKVEVAPGQVWEVRSLPGGAKVRPTLG